jgi:hypothetical protein
MKIKGVSYDVGRVMGGNWRPVFDPKVVHRELEIIKNDLHCNAARICGLDIERLMTATEDALKLGLEVWLSPEMWDKSQDETLAYITKAATAAEKLREQYPDKLAFLVGSEITLFMQGIVPGRGVMQRMGGIMKNPADWKAGKYNVLMNEWLEKANESVRKVFHGKVSYASLVWEAVDWKLFDFIGLDHYWSVKIKDQYVEMLKPSLASGKPVVVTEFGFRTYKGAATSTEGMAGDLVDHRRPGPLLIMGFVLNEVLSSLFGIQSAPPKMKLKEGNWERDEAGQARALVEQLETLDRAGVDGAFIMTFISPIAPYSDDPRKDYDMNSYSLVKSYEGGKHGTTYPGMTWEPKKAFKAVADYYATH